MREASVGHQCPECVAEGRRTSRPARTAFGGSGLGAQSYVTKTLIGLNVLMMLIAAASAGGGGLVGGAFGGLGGTSTPLHRWGAVIGYASYVDGGPAHGVAAGEYYRLFTAMFLHYGLLHIALNMWALWVLGRQLEYALGPVRFLALYLLCGFGGNVAVYLFSAPNIPTAGASTAIFGLFGAFLPVLRRLGRDTSALIPILVVNLVFTLTVPGISIAGHLGGLASGVVIGAGIAYAPRRNRTAMQAAVCLVYLALLIILTLVRSAGLAG